MSIRHQSSVEAAPMMPSSEKQTFFPINDLPKELILEVFARLGDVDRAQCIKVCRLWRVLGSRQETAHLKIFGKQAWEKYWGFRVEGEIPPIPDSIIALTERLRQQVKGERQAPDCTLFLMPKDLSLDLLKELIRQSSIGSRFSVNHGFWSPVLFPLQNRRVEHSYWVLMTNEVIEGSRGKTKSEQQKFLIEKTEGECQYPEVLEVAVCCFMHLANSEHYLFGAKERCWVILEPWKFTRCQEESDKSNWLVGGFDSGGLGILFDFGKREYGAACRRKFIASIND